MTTTRRYGLFDEAEARRLARRRDPISSKAAAAKHAKSGQLGRHLQMTLDAVRRVDGLTAVEYDVVMGTREVARKRLPTLRDLGLVESRPNGTKSMTWHAL